MLNPNEYFLAAVRDRVCDTLIQELIGTLLIKTENLYKENNNYRTLKLFLKIKKPGFFKKPSFSTLQILTTKKT